MLCFAKAKISLNAFLLHWFDPFSILYIHICKYCVLNLVYLIEIYEKKLPKSDFLLLAGCFFLSLENFQTQTTNFTEQSTSGECDALLYICVRQRNYCAWLGLVLAPRGDTKAHFPRGSTKGDNGARRMHDLALLFWKGRTPNASSVRLRGERKKKRNTAIRGWTVFVFRAHGELNSPLSQKFCFAPLPAVAVSAAGMRFLLPSKRASAHKKSNQISSLVSGCRESSFAPSRPAMWENARGAQIKVGSSACVCDLNARSHVPTKQRQRLQRTNHQKAHFSGIFHGSSENFLMIHAIFFKGIIK